jgi:hypothetical protein
MNKELRSELETQVHLLETMRAEMETFKGAKSATGGGEQSFNMLCFHCGMPGIHKGGNKFCQWKYLSQAEAREKGLRFVTDALQAANYETNLVSENPNLFISTWNTQWGLNTIGFPWFYDYDKMGGMLCLEFSDRWVV